MHNQPENYDPFASGDDGDDGVVIDLTHGVSLHLEQFEATRNASRPEHPYVDHSEQFASTDAFGIHIPAQAMASGHEFTATLKPAPAATDPSWLQRLVPFKR